MTYSSTSSLSRDGSPFLTVSKRFFWLVMLLFHVGAIRSAWSALTGSSGTPDWALGGMRLSILVASAAFFALKMVDVAALRLKSGWRPLVASIVVVALLHVNVLDRAVESDSPYTPAPLAAMALVGALVESSTLRRGLVRLSTRILGDDSGVRRVTPPPGFASHHVDRASVPYPFTLFCGLLLPRPPPAA